MSKPSYKYDYAVVVPVYESREIIVELASLLKDSFDKMNKTYQLIFVDDSKTNSTWKFVEQLHQQYNSIVTGVRLTRNYGQHNATLCGFQYADAPWIITMDDDLEIYPNQIQKLIAKQVENDSDVVSGSFKRNRSNPLFNMFNGLFVNAGENIKKENSTKSSFRLIRKEIADKLLGFPHHFIFIDRVFMWYTQAIDNVLVEHHPSKKIASGYQGGDRFNLLTNIFFFFSSIPIKAMTYLSFILSIITFLIGLLRIYRKIFYDVPLLGYTSIIVAILFSTSLILFALGLIGEYLRRIYAILNNQPQYQIKAVLQ